MCLLSQTMLYRITVIAVSVAVFSCSDSPSNDDRWTRSMFYWKTVFTVDSAEREVMNTLNISHVYVRYLDVDGYGLEDAVPRQPLSLHGPLRVDGLEIVPTVFLTPSVFRSASPADTTKLEQLALRLRNFMYEVDSAVFVYQGLTPRPQVRRVLVDYDWTPSTSKTYFAFLRILANVMDSTEVECTVRLWQYRHTSQAGIPPVQRAVLMCYNMDDYADPWTENAVATPNLLRSYVKESSAQAYPLDLDLALPLYRQSVLFTEDRYSSPNILQTNLPIGRHTFQHDTVIGSTHLPNRSVIRVDGATAEVLVDMHQHLRNTVPRGRVVGVSLFSLDTAEINRVGIRNLQRVLEK